MSLCYMKTNNLVNPWTDTTNSSFSSTVSIDSTLVNLTDVNSLQINDPLREFVKEKAEEGNEQRLFQLEHLLGEAWTEVPEKLVEDLTLALETDQLDNSITQFHQPSGSGSHSHKVLVHWVSPEETLPGIALKYHIRTEHLRRFNRLWPSDNKAHRPYLFIPLALTPKLNHYSREYPDLFYELPLRSLDALPVKSDLPPSQSAIPSILQPSSNHKKSINSHSQEGTQLKDHEPRQRRPILVIPHGQLKYFPTKKTSSLSHHPTSLSHHSRSLSTSVITSHLQSLAPLFNTSSSPTRSTHYHSTHSLPDELETEILTQNLLSPSRQQTSSSSTPTKFSQSSFDLMSSSRTQLSGPTVKVESGEVELEMQPLFKSSS